MVAPNLAVIPEGVQPLIAITSRFHLSFPRPAPPCCPSSLPNASFISFHHKNPQSPSLRTFPNLPPPRHTSAGRHFPHGPALGPCPPCLRPAAGRAGGAGRGGPQPARRGCEYRGQGDSSWGWPGPLPAADSGRPGPGRLGGAGRERLSALPQPRGAGGMFPARPGRLSRGVRRGGALLVRGAGPQPLPQSLRCALVPVGACVRRAV